MTTLCLSHRKCEKCGVTKKEGSYLLTVPIDYLQRTPERMDLMLIYNIAHRPPELLSSLPVY
jgi:hypothetical protein